MMKEASNEGRKAYLDKRDTDELNSGLSSPKSELQPPTKKFNADHTSNSLQISSGQKNETEAKNTVLPKSLDIQTQQKDKVVKKGLFKALEDHPVVESKRAKEEIESVIAEVEGLQV